MLIHEAQLEFAAFGFPITARLSHVRAPLFTIVAIAIVVAIVIVVVVFIVVVTAIVAAITGAIVIVPAGLLAFSSFYKC
jgi:hypothetical protein